MRTVVSVLKYGFSMQCYKITFILNTNRNILQYFALYDIFHSNITV